MRVHRLESEGGFLLAVTGIGAHGILAPEAGLHVFESPQGESTFDRIAVQVAVAPASRAEPALEPLERARLAFSQVSVPQTVVRRYRLQPSPLVRDSVREWRTGRLERVLAGDFDLMVGG